MSANTDLSTVEKDLFLNLIIWSEKEKALQVSGGLYIWLNYLSATTLIGTFATT